MEQKRSVKKLIIGVVLAAAAINFGIILFLYPTSRIAQSSVKPTSTPKAVVTATTASFSYTGEAGKDALTIMKAKTQVVQNASGLVTSIHGVKADDKKHQYWAFYVNGKYASVGPKDYVTKSTDKIEWKMEHY